MYVRSSFLSRFVLLGFAAIASAVCFAGAANAASPDEQRAEIRRMAMSTLDQLYAAQPSARAAIQKAAGYGMGITKSHLVWVFERESNLQDFVNNGLILGADVNLQVNPGVGGDMYQGAVQVQPGVWLYQLSDAGLALDLTVEGTKYFKDPDLN